MRAFGFLVALLAGSAANAADSLPLEAASYVEQIDEGGRASIRRIEPNAQLGRGERIVTVLKWKGTGGGLVTSRVPAGLRLQSASRGDVLVSTDGGVRWAPLADYRQVPTGITHIRWPLGQGEGQLTYRAIVR